MVEVAQMPTATKLTPELARRLGVPVDGLPNTLPRCEGHALVAVIGGTVVCLDDKASYRRYRDRAGGARTELLLVAWDAA